MSENEWVVVRRQVALFGRVVDGEGRPAAGAQVRLDGGTPMWRAQVKLARRTGTSSRYRDRAPSAADGVFYFLDLPEGDYTASVFLPGRPPTSARAQATVFHMEAGDIHGQEVALFLTPFTPDEVAGCRFWLDARELDQTVDGEMVMAWPDRSGQGSGATATREDRAPVYREKALAGRPALFFDRDAPVYLRVPWKGAADAHTFFVVCAGDGGQTAGDLLSGAGGVSVSLRGAAGGGPKIVVAAFCGERQQVTVYHDDGSTATGVAGWDRYAGKSHRRLAIGAKHTLRSRYYHGYVATVLHYDRCLPAAERQLVVDYLCHTYDFPTS